MVIYRSYSPGGNRKNYLLTILLAPMGNIGNKVATVGNIIQLRAS